LHGLLKCLLVASDLGRTSWLTWGTGAVRWGLLALLLTVLRLLRWVALLGLRRIALALTLRRKLALGRWLTL